jgi:ABC-type transport system substrate-binding protein
MGPQEALTWMQSAQLITEDLGKIGIKTHVTPVIRNIYLQRGGTKPGDFDITMTVLLDYQYAKTDSGTFWNMTSLEDPQIDALVDQILQTPDLTQQEQLSHQFQVLLAQKYDVECALLTTNAHEAVYSYVKGEDPNYTPRSAWQEYRWLDK